MAEPNTEREALSADLDRVRRDFHQLLDHTKPDEWRKPTQGTRWTNEQLLFHMVFGYMIVQKLLILARVSGHLPKPITHRYMSLLNAATGPFDAINYHGSCLAARVFNRNRMGAKLDRVIDSLQRSLNRLRDSDLQRGMPYPDRWDPYFHNYMTLADLFAYPGQHYNHHRKQLTLETIQ
ncbi:DinB family protein [Nocardia sp. NEAU-G5]|uniref:DinB family protein n=1 Tax=Nocardia albiluteola TaxID=2842303 RepID=A0ABS6BAI4_9NOCA|nr:DinB family protein [Nocardia albiluteola]MBU3066415.1 DinB family protein [Nocardia albiluteola]